MSRPQDDRFPFGLATAAVAENRQVAEIAGLSATRIEMVACTSVRAAVSHWSPRPVRC